MPVIRVLPESVSCRIAAGEVVQRPASVVKELLDNSIDAGAKRITVEAVTGGRELIRVSDDGSGMARDDVALCLERHATSKIARVEDLDAIGTLGFRGEALAAIASVSVVEIATRRAGEVEGTLLRCEGGGERLLAPTGCPPGTSIKIARLFFNTPARQKFLKSPTVELGHITEMVTRAALAYPEIHFRLDHNGRIKLDLPHAASRIDRLVTLFGANVAEAMTAVDEGSRKVHLSGFVSLPPAARKTAEDIFFFVNDRFVRDRKLMAALQQAYQSSLPQRAYPVAVLFLELDPSLVDINVHPSKEEVRFGPEVDVFSAVYHAVIQALRQSHPLLAGPLETQIVPALREAPLLAGPPEPCATPLKVSAPNLPGLESAPARIAAPSWRAPFTPSAQPALQTPEPLTKVDDHTSLNTACQSGLAERHTEVERSQRSSSTPTALQSMGDVQEVEPLAHRLTARAQIVNKYIVAESTDRFFLVDQHALHERIRFEELRAARQARRLVSQPLLIPEQMEVPAHHVQFLEATLPVLAEFGFQLEPFGPSGWALYAIPACLPLEQAWPLIYELLDEFRQAGGHRGITGLEEAVLARLACKSAVKAGEALDLPAMQHLLDLWSNLPHARTCPHGRPAVWTLTWEEVAKLFHRS